MKTALFLDRDGVINVNYGYVYEHHNIDFIAGIFDLVKRANESDMMVIVVSNQSGVARGYYQESDVDALHKWMAKEFRSRGAIIDDFFYCPHHPTAGIKQYLKDCECRKPKTGMLRAAAEKHGVLLNQSTLVGDKITDMQAAMSANIKNAYWLDGQAVVDPLAFQCLNRTTISIISTLYEVILP